MNASIKFSREEEQNNQLPFLDVLVQRHRDGKINTSVFRTRSNSDIVLHYSGNHSTSHKRLCMKTLFDRAQLYFSGGKTLALEHRPKPKQAGYSWRLFIPMKTQLTDKSPLTHALLL